MPARGGNAYCGQQSEAFGIVQMSCGLYVPKFRHGNRRRHFEELIIRDMVAIDQGLRSSFEVKGKKEFELKNIEELRKDPPEPPDPLPHTWLAKWSRHKALGMPRVFFFPDGAGESGTDSLSFPRVLDWPERQPAPEAPFKAYVRVQRTLDNPSWTDHNDRLLIRKDSHDETAMSLPCQRLTRSLNELQEFFVWLYAQRRSAIFASNLSERIYHIWLPPGLLSYSPNDGSKARGPLAFLPMITMVRRPSKREWRRTVSVSIHFVPVRCDETGTLTPRSLVHKGSREIELLTRSLDGGSTLIRSGLEEPLRLEESPLKEYLTALMSDKRRGRLLDDDMEEVLAGWQGTRRQWIELISAVGADAIGRWAGPWRHSRRHKRRLCDALLRSLRQTTIWSVRLAGPGLDLELRDGRFWPVTPPLRTSAQPLRRRMSRRSDLGVPDEHARRMAAFPGWATSALESLSSPGSPPDPDDRIDDVSCVDTHIITWHIPRRRCLLTMEGMPDEAFPGYSLLTTSGWIGHMVIGAASATETMLELGRRISQPLRGGKLAENAYLFTLELEDMYDLDVTWLMYAKFFRGIRARLGIDQQYNGIRERVETLARYTQVQERLRTEDNSLVVAIIAALLAIVLIYLGARSAAYKLDEALVFLGGSVLLVAIGFIYSLLRRRRLVRRQN